MMTKDQKAADRQRRYRVREQARARALFAGATEIDIAWFGINAEGEHVAIGYDGQAIPLNAPKRTPPVEAQPAKPKVYAPKSWDASKWNSNVKVIRDQAMSKQQVLDSWAEIAQKQNTPDAHKRVKHATAVVNALPDTPDWYELLPLADEA